MLTHKHIYTCRGTLKHTNSHTFMKQHMFTHIHISKQSHAYKHKYVYKLAHTQTYTHVETHTSIQLHTYKHKEVYKLTHIYRQIQYIYINHSCYNPVNWGILFAITPFKVFLSFLDYFLCLACVIIPFFYVQLLLKFYFKIWNFVICFQSFLHVLSEMRYSSIH